MNWIPIPSSAVGVQWYPCSNGKDRRVMRDLQKGSQGSQEYIRDPLSLYWRGPSRLLEEAASWLGFQGWVRRAKLKSKSQQSERRGWWGQGQLLAVLLPKEFGTKCFHSQHLWLIPPTLIHYNPVFSSFNSGQWSQWVNSNIKIPSGKIHHPQLLIGEEKSLEAS